MGPIDAERDDIVKWCASGLYAGAADTVSSATKFAAITDVPTSIDRLGDHILRSAYGALPRCPKPCPS